MKKIIRTTIAEAFPVDYGQDLDRPAGEVSGPFHEPGSHWDEPYHPATFRLRTIRAQRLRLLGWTVTVEALEV